MKKNYIIPAIDFIHVQLHKVIAVSIKISATNYDGEAKIESRRHNSIFDDDAPTSGSGSIWDE